MARDQGRRRVLQGAAAATGAAVLGGCQRSTVPAGRVGADLWFTYGGRNREVLERLVRRYNEGQSRFFVRAVFQGDYFEGLAKLRVATAAGAGPTFSHVIGEVVPYLAAADVLETLDDYPGAHSLGVIPALGQTGTWTAGARHPLVALPFNRSTPIAYLNGDHFRATGLAPPGTWDELRAAARKLRREAGGRTTRFGFGCPIAWWFWVALTGQAGGSIVESDGTPSLGGDAGVAAIRLWQALVHTDRTMKPPPGRDYNAWQATNQDFLTGRTSMIWTSTAFLKYLEDHAKFPVVAAPLPRRERAAVPTGGTFWVMMKEGPPAPKEAAWDFLCWMHGTTPAIEWATSTGYMPVTASAVRTLEDRGYYRKSPNDRVAIDQLKVALPWPWSPTLFRLQREIVQPRLEEAVLAGGNPATLMATARRIAQDKGLGATTSVAASRGGGPG